jgi:hypothetical protein
MNRIRNSTAVLEHRYRIYWQEKGIHFMSLDVSNYVLGRNSKMAENLNDYALDKTFILHRGSTKSVDHKLIIIQPLKKFPALYGTRKLITLFTRVRD